LSRNSGGVHATPRLSRCERPPADVRLVPPRREMPISPKTGSVSQPRAAKIGAASPSGAPAVHPSRFAQAYEHHRAEETLLRYASGCSRCPMVCAESAPGGHDNVVRARSRFQSRHAQNARISRDGSGLAIPSDVTTGLKTLPRSGPPLACLVAALVILGCEESPRGPHGTLGSGGTGGAGTGSSSAGGHGGSGAGGQSSGYCGSNYGWDGGAPPCTGSGGAGGTGGANPKCASCVQPTSADKPVVFPWDCICDTEPQTCSDTLDSWLTFAHTETTVCYARAEYPDCGITAVYSVFRLDGLWFTTTFDSATGQMVGVVQPNHNNSFGCPGQPAVSYSRQAGRVPTGCQPTTCETFGDCAGTPTAPCAR
jgi:hypothetical protein